MTATRTCAPFLRSDNDTLTVMTDVGIALIPPSAAAIRYFGLRAFELLLIALLTSLAAARIAAVFRHNVRRFDGSALISGVASAAKKRSGVPMGARRLHGSAASPDTVMTRCVSGSPRAASAIAAAVAMLETTIPHAVGILSCGISRFRTVRISCFSPPCG